MRDIWDYTIFYLLEMESVKFYTENSFEIFKSQIFEIFKPKLCKALNSIGKSRKFHSKISYDGKTIFKWT
jgi:hypothetical protein